MRRAFTVSTALLFPTMEHTNLTIEGMTCEHCVRAVRGRLEQTPGVKVGDVQVGSVTIDYDPSKITMDEIEEVIADEGYTVAS